ncbi:hypothetical protein DFH27DRAFT_653315 [Peziza echinospora]|nr:hypothetical protein DFH27DRAFT_653315 [Peziza echinospora]
MSGYEEPIMDIPGYYYDPDRKKYFKILPNHAARALNNSLNNLSSFASTSSTTQPTSASNTTLPSTTRIYTPATISHLKNTAAEHAALLLRKEHLKSRAHLRIRNDPFLRTSLFKEVWGVNGREEMWEARRKCWAKGLRRQKAELDVGVERGVGVGCFQVLEEGLVEDDDEEGGNRKRRVKVVVGTRKGNVQTTTYVVDSNTGQWDVVDRAANVIDLRDAITSMTLSSNEILLATTLGGPTPPIIFIGSPHRNEREHSFLSPSSTPHPQTILRPNARSLWSSTSLESSTSSSSVTFAVGTSNGPYIATTRPHGYTTEQLYCPSDVFCVEYLKPGGSGSGGSSTKSEAGSSQTTPLLYGCRDGGMRCYDPRLPYSSSSPLSSTTATTIRGFPSHQPSRPATHPTLINHASIISHIHAINSHLIILKGPQQAALYDIRYPRPAAPSAEYAARTRPVVVYEELCDAEGFRVDEGFAVGKGGEVMAGMVKGRAGEVGVWSTVTGGRLEWGKCDGGGGGGRGEGRRGGEGEGYSKQISFVEMDGGEEEVWATRGGRIERYAAL